MAGIRYFLILGGFLLFAVNEGFSQHSDLTRKNSKINNYKTVKFKKNKKMAVICPIFHVSEYPYQGIGFKMGDPLAITYKFYATEFFAIGIDVGKASTGLYRDLHQDRFKFDPIYQDSIFVSYSVLNQNVFSARVFYYKEGPKSVKGLDFYVGAGWQMQFADVKYDYIAIFSGPGGTRNAGQTTFHFQPMGPEFSFGLEYAYFDAPLTAFMEASLFLNIDPSQQWRKFQGGIGLRYVF